MKLLRDFTMARVGLGRTGNSLPTAEVLAFQLAHARARDAVYHALDLKLDLRLQSAAENRAAFLRRPDLGRRLSRQSREDLEGCRGPFDILIAAADGLSALAVDRHVPALLGPLLERLDGAGWSRAPLMSVEQGRVAIGDEIGSKVGASIALVLIGERPGLSAPDSLGAYLTWNPAVGRTDAERNCVSNIRPEGLGYEEAAGRIFSLLTEARARGLTGVALKEDGPRLAGN